MLFNPHINKQATQVYFSKKNLKALTTVITFNGISVLTSPCQKRLGLVLDNKLSLNEHITQKINECNEIIGLMKRLSLIRSQKHLLTIYQNFVKNSSGLNRHNL